MGGVWRGIGCGVEESGRCGVGKWVWWCGEENGRCVEECEVGGEGKWVW